MEKMQFLLEDETQTIALAANLASRVKSGDVIALYGDLGAGKTAFSRGFIRASMGYEEEVPSPTFTLVQIYDSPAHSIYHFDLYRIEDPDEVFELGIEDAFADGVSLIEWPERLGNALPNNALMIDLRHGENPEHRTLTLSSHSTEWAARLQGLKLESSDAP